MFYDGSELLSRSKYDIFFSLGGRNIGKSTFWQRFVLRHFIKYGEKFGIIVKYKDDFSTFCANYFSQEWMDKMFKRKGADSSDYEIDFKRGKYFIRKKSDKLSEDDMKSGWVQCGYAIALNMNATLKSTTTFQDIDNLLFEEFMPLEDRYIGSVKDPEKEPKLLQSIYQTIARGNKGEHTRRVRLICISNNYTMNNPYFTRFNILNMVTSNPNSIYQQFYTYDKGDLHYALEFSQLEPEKTGIEADEEDTGVKFSDFRNELHITKDKPKRPFIQLTFDGKYILNVCNYNESIVVYKGDKIIDPINIPVYSCSKFKSKEAFGMKVFKSHTLYKEIVTLFELNNMYYDKLESFIQLTNILAWTGTK